MKMEKIRQTRGEAQDRNVVTNLEKNIKKNFGSKCSDHEEECCVCEIYKALNTIQRLYGYKETN